MVVPSVVGARRDPPRKWARLGPVGSEYMSERGPFWSTVPGLVTGAAGVLTAIVGLLTVSVQLGWIGDGSSGNGGSSTSSSGVPGSSTPTTGATPGSTVAGSSNHPGATSSASSAFAVEPTAVEFPSIGAREATVVVRNTGDAALTVKPPTVTGSGAASFTVADVGCTREKLAPGRSCDVQVAFAPKGAGQFSARLVVATSEVARQQEVELKGSALVG